MSVLGDIANKLFGANGSADQDDGTPLKPISSVSDQSMDERKLVEYVKDKIDQARQTNSRIAIEGIYLTNVAYLLGFDGVYYDSTYRQFKNIDPKRKLSRNRFKVNKILPQVQNRLARLTQSPPRFDVRPKSNEASDKDASRLGLEVIKDVYDKQRFPEKQQEILMSAMQGGHAYAQVLWDPMLGAPMVDPNSEEFTGYEGDVRIDVLNALQVFPDPLAKCIEDCQWIIKATVRKLDYYRDRYAERGDAVKEEGAWLLSSIYDMKANSLTAVGIVGAQTNDQQKNSAIELVYYERRSKDHPNGRMVVCASGVLLEDKELPIGEFDIVKFDDIMIGGRYNAEAVITHLRPVQDQYNITRTRMANWVKAHLGGKYLVAKGAGLAQEAINNGDTEVVEFNPVPNAPPPMPMAIPQIPQYAYKEIEGLDQELDYIAGINEISRGVLPSASIPAAGMAFLQEQDQTRIGVQTTRNEVGYAKVFSCVLKYVSKYYVMPRMIKVAGDGLQYAVKEFVGKDLCENDDVLVVPGSTIPTSKVLRRQDILNDFNLGLYGNPADPKVRAKINEMLEDGDVNELWKKQSLTIARCNQIIKLIEQEDQQGVSQLLSEYDNHSMHLDKMDEYRLSDKYEGLSPTAQQLFNYVMEWRLNALVNISNPQIMQQQNMAQLMVNNMHKMQASGAMTGGQPGMPPGAPGVPPQQQANTLTNVQPAVDAQGMIQAPLPQAAPVPNATPPIK